MQTQIFLIAPADAEAAPLADHLRQVLAGREVAALLLQRGTRAENAYKDFARKVIPVAQQAGCAVLLEGAPGLVRMLGADGLHVSTGLPEVQEAVKALRPQMIVGVGNIQSRDDAMAFGELEVDYLLFGPLAGETRPEDRDLAHWWAETMEIPCVLADPAADFESFDAAGSEFIGLPMPSMELAR